MKTGIYLVDLPNRKYSQKANNNTASTFSSHTNVISRRALTNAQTYSCAHVYTPANANVHENLENEYSIGRYYYTPLKELLYIREVALEHLERCLSYLDPFTAH